MSIAEPKRDVAALPLAPKNPLPYRERLKAIREFHTGTNKLRDAGGPVTRVTLGPRWLIPPIVLATSPQGIRDIVSVRDGSVDKTSAVATELRRLLGGNLFVLPHAEWLPRRRTLQPVFTRQRVRQFGGHMAEAAEIVCAKWREGDEIDLDAQCRTLTLRALGRSVLGLDLDERSDAVAEPLRVATSYAVRRALRPLRAPGWMPTPARRRARAAAETIRGLADEILQACRADAGLEAPLVHALIAATDPETGKALSDNEIRDEMIIFLFAGHDTTTTTLTYALWALGRHRDLQERVAAEAAELGDRQLTPDDVARLGFTVQVLQEALRLCPPGPTGTRMATRDVEVAGYRVTAGTMLAFGRMAVQTDPGLWDDTLRFDPDRFSPERANGRDRWQYVPFGGGPRSCIGDHFAMLEATLALATIVRRVEIESLSDDFPLAVPFTMVAASPIRARVRLRH
ncbi:cytochrome P450 [Mycobacterium intracellulare]|uniref:cytochrome P450 n=1 Tax=Mycobacterium intracellulare TaxID=1767 RepID=UPI00044D51F5|nr:cytochrome P450 [Mycobacterium intracellulare]AOS92528.1 cytochrome P450 [Mycobacterium intracellulare subsp. chimaera]ARV82813.1 cytochrome P450 [Mycobacterium intracellulare subsp. chimaera]ASL09997.1 cytochrome P450 [Mycobacterium intracellulare subsp. chimaera]ASL21898.1 cytochrome P450 [Mycobacterium intracellulare subsp. chimaera]ETZ29416.1 cytochrome P450 family protein [Mycobacterium intracellulare MIN_052511_1280]